MASGSGHGRYACFEDEKRYPPPSRTAGDIFLSVSPPAQPGLRASFLYPWTIRVLGAGNRRVWA